MPDTEQMLSVVAPLLARLDEAAELLRDWMDTMGDDDVIMRTEAWLDESDHPEPTEEPALL